VDKNRKWIANLFCPINEFLRDKIGTDVYVVEA